MAGMDSGDRGLHRGRRVIECAPVFHESPLVFGGSEPLLPQCGTVHRGVSRGYVAAALVRIHMGGIGGGRIH